MKPQVVATGDENAARRPRMPYLDNLYMAVITLVVLMHAAIWKVSARSTQRDWGALLAVVACYLVAYLLRKLPFVRSIL